MNTTGDEVVLPSVDSVDVGGVSVLTIALGDGDVWSDVGGDGSGVDDGGRGGGGGTVSDVAAEDTCNALSSCVNSRLVGVSVVDEGGGGGGGAARVSGAVVVDEGCKALSNADKRSSVLTGGAGELSSGVEVGGAADVVCSVSGMREGVIDGGGCAEAHCAESGLRQTSVEVLTVVELVRSLMRVGGAISALVWVPGSIEGPPGKQDAS